MNKSLMFLKRQDVAELLEVILSRMQAILDKNLIGLYLYGSLAAGDFDDEISDIDLLAAVETEIDQNEFDRLDNMHDELVKTYSRWKNRIEIAYVSRYALKTFKLETSRIANISPGEPFHKLTAGKDWLINWYLVRENGLTLFGPWPETIIEPISKEEFVQNVREQAKVRAENIENAKNSRPYQAYTIMTMCRALYAVKNGHQASKRQAADWLANLYPVWAGLLKQAFIWRAAALRKEKVDHQEHFAETEEFVNFIIEKIRN